MSSTKNSTVPALCSRRARRFHGGFAHRAPHSVIHDRRRRFLDHFLVPPLHRTLALSEINHVPVVVAEHLNLDMPRPRQIFFEIKRPSPKAFCGFRSRRRATRAREFASRSTTRMPLPPPPLPPSAHGKPVFTRLRQRRLGGSQRIERAGNGGNTGFARYVPARRVFDPRRSIASGDGPMKPCLRTHTRAQMRHSRARKP